MPISLNALLLVLGCSAAFSALDLLRKLLAERFRTVPLLLLLTLGPIPLLLGWVALDSGTTISRAYLLPGLGSVALNVAANLAYLRALRVSSLSATIPLLSLTPVFTALLAVPILGETPTPWQWLGVGLVVAGALRLNLGGGQRSPELPFWRGLAVEPGGLLMTVVALLWSLAMPLDKLAVQASSVPVHALALHVGVALGMVAPLVAQGSWRELKGLSGAWVLLAAAVLCGLLALTFQLAAISRVWVGLVETVKRGWGSVAALIMGRALLGERLTPGKVVAVAMMAIGVAVILS